MRELRANDQELVRQRSVLSAEAFSLKRREFEAKVAQVQREVQDRKRELDKAFEFPALQGISLSGENRTLFPGPGSIRRLRCVHPRYGSHRSG